MRKKYKTRIEITSAAENKEEAMEILDDYLSGNIISGIDMKYEIRQVRFYDHRAAKALAVVLLIGMAFLFNVRPALKVQSNMETCQMAAVQPPLKTSNVSANKARFKNEWEEKQTREALNFIKK